MPSKNCVLIVFDGTRLIRFYLKVPRYDHFGLVRIIYDTPWNWNSLVFRTVSFFLFVRPVSLAARNRALEISLNRIMVLSISRFSFESRLVAHDSLFVSFLAKRKKQNGITIRGSFVVENFTRWSLHSMKTENGMFWCCKRCRPRHIDLSMSIQCFWQTIVSLFERIHS